MGLSLEGPIQAPQDPASDPPHWCLLTNHVQTPLPAKFCHISPFLLSVETRLHPPTPNPSPTSILSPPQIPKPLMLSLGPNVSHRGSPWLTSSPGSHISSFINQGQVCASVICCNHLFTSTLATALVYYNSYCRTGKRIHLPFTGPPRNGIFAHCSKRLIFFNPAKMSDNL